MAKTGLRHIARRHLDRRFAAIGQPAIAAMRRPPTGWALAIRQAIGMSTAQLAHRLGISQPAALALERSEAARTIKLESLERLATALGCRLVYALVPDQPLEQMVEARARAVAEQQLTTVEQTMALEGQSVTDVEAREDLLQELIDGLTDRDLWREGTRLSTEDREAFMCAFDADPTPELVDLMQLHNEVNGGK